MAKNGTTTQTYTYGNTDWVDLLTAVNGNTITYDANGNPLSYYNGTSTYTNLSWEQGRQLVSVTKGTTTTSYDYDADGVRSKKTVGSSIHTYVTQNGRVIRETIGSGSRAMVLDFIYDSNGNPYAIKQSGNGGNSFTTYYYLLNRQGDVVALTNDSGAIVVRYTYNAWGELSSVTDVNSNPITSTAHIAHINPLRYRGYYYDTDTGFYYLQSRYYDPVCHRFINADGYASTGQGFTGTNMFAYCGNNPVVNADTTGELWAEIIIATTLIVAMAATLVACSEEEKNWPEDCPYFYWAPGAKSTDTNCYTYVFDYYVWDDPGHACGKRIKPDAPVTREYIIEGVLGDAAKRKGEGVVLLINSPEDLPDGALLVVCKISSDEVDYHFAVQLPNGVFPIMRNSDNSCRIVSATAG